MIQFYLYEVLSIVKVTDTESEMVVANGGVEGGRGRRGARSGECRLNGYSLLWVMKTFWSWIEVVVCTTM